MRARTALTAAVVASLTAAAGVATAQSDPRITADPIRVDHDAIQTVRGRQRHVSDTGRFRFRWIPDNKNIAPGRWRLVARMRCESGKDGSTIFVRASTLIRIRP